MNRDERMKALSGVTGAQTVGGGAQAAPTPADAPSAPQTAAQGIYKRSDGSAVPMADLNPHHRAAAARKAERAGNNELATQLRASGPLE